MINARGESVSTKPSFRAAFKQRRCLLPADGFYEWRRPDGRASGRDPKIPYNISLNAGGPFAMAGIWEVGQGPDGAERPTCAIITTEANEVVYPIHDRMPVILAPEDWQAWLSGDAVDEVKALLRPAPNDLLRAYRVSTRVNRIANDGPDLIKPAGREPDENDSNQGSLF